MSGVIGRLSFVVFNPLSFTALALSAFSATLLLAPLHVVAAPVPAARVEGQPLAANVDRLLNALDFLGHPLPDNTTTALRAAVTQRDDAQLQQHLDPHVLLVVSINPELRVKVARGPADAHIQQHGFTPVLVKVINDGTVNGPLNISSPNAGAVFDGTSDFSLKRQQQTKLNTAPNRAKSTERFLSVEIFRKPPLTPTLSGLRVEYVLALVSSTESGQREATISFDIGQGTQDIGFRGDVPILFAVDPAIPVSLSIHDHDGTPTTAKLTFRDAAGRVFPSQVKRIAPDFFFQPQIYRRDGDTVLLPPGEFTLTSSRGPEYVVQTQQVIIPEQDDADTNGTAIEIALKRWVDPMTYGYYCGDHHIHGAGCSHYQHPTQGASPADMFLQVKGEGLNVGCVLTWGPCFDFQRRYFSPVADDVSEPLTLLKYDLEISGFGSAPMGHVCLLNLKDQTFPGTNGTVDHWPSWTVPVLRWTKEQGGVTGFPHSDMGTHPDSAAKRLLQKWDSNRDGRLSPTEATTALLVEPFDKSDTNFDGHLDHTELTAAINSAADRLPNLIIPEMNGGGAMEIVVATPEGVCDFISAMDTARIGEWNTWYHLLNCGFPLKLSGETDFPCMSSRRVGQGRVYVRLGKVDRVDFTDWVNGIAAGRSYVSDGFAHALDFTAGNKRPGEDDVVLAGPQTVTITTTVAFAEEIPEGVAYGSLSGDHGRRNVGDTSELHADRSNNSVRPGKRLVEIVVNGLPVAKREVPADGAEHPLTFDVPIDRSSWVAVRHFPSMHTNPVNVIVADKPIRASRNSAQWCLDAVELLWTRRAQMIAQHERPAALAAYERAKATYRRIATESAE